MREADDKKTERVELIAKPLLRRKPENRAAAEPESSQAYPAEPRVQWAGRAWKHSSAYWTNRDVGMEADA